MKNITEIETPYWQKKRGSVGEIVTDLDDIEQCLDNIFNISKGSIPFQPNIGSNIIEAVGRKDKEAFEIAKTLLLEEFSTQEPRAEIISLSSSQDTNGTIILYVTFQSKITKKERSKKYYV